MSTNIEPLIDKHIHTQSTQLVLLVPCQWMVVHFIWILDFLLFRSIVSQSIQHQEETVIFYFEIKLSPGIHLSTQIESRFIDPAQWQPNKITLNEEKNVSKIHKKLFPCKTFLAKLKCL